MPKINSLQKPLVALVTTGGTIAESKSADGLIVPTLSGEALLSSAPALGALADFEIHEFSNVDSSHLGPENWLGLASLVNEILQDDRITGIVITHGTDTMELGAYFLMMTCAKNKPVVFTGAIREASALYPDGQYNLIQATLTATASNCQNLGVVIAMNQYIYSPRSCFKEHTYNVHAFAPGLDGYVGHIQNEEVILYHEVHNSLHFTLPKTLEHVPLIKIYSGDDGSFINFSVSQSVKAMVIECYGTGNVNPFVAKAIMTAIEKGIHVVICTRVPFGGVVPLYGMTGGSLMLDNLGAILAGDLSSEKARILTMISISNKQEDLKTLFQDAAKRN